VGHGDDIFVHRHHFVRKKSPAAGTFRLNGDHWDLADLMQNTTNHRAAAILAAIFATALCVAAGAYVAHTRQLRAELLRADPDSIAVSSRLLDYAVPRGQDGYRQHCASCHGAGLHGDPTRGVPDLADADWLYGTGRIGEIERVILFGIRSGNSKGWNLASMPAFATAHPYTAYKMDPLTPNEVRDVATYVAAFHQASADPAAAARGAKVFHKQGMCFDCHGGDARGDPAIGAPDLTDAVWLYGDGSMPAIERTVSHGLAGVCPAWIGRLDPGMIRAIAVYVHSMGAGSNRDRS
jgi:cytochrome c oxidase cbb3-type subunit 3